MFPLPAGSFQIDDGYSGGYDVSGQPDSGAWQVVAFNTGQFPHTLVIRLLTDLVVPREPDFELLSGLGLSNYSTQAGDWRG